MSTRRAKQIIYGALYAIVLVAICAGAYALFVLPFRNAPAAVCTPGTCAPTSTAPLAASLVGTFVTGSGHYTFLGQIANGDTSYGATPVSYELDLDDASGTVLQSSTGQTFIYPGQNKYVLLPNIVASQAFDHAALVVTGGQWYTGFALGTSPGIAPGSFAVENVAPATGAATVSVGGTITNTSIAAYRQVIVMVLFKDLNNVVIGASQTELDNMKGGETRNFSVIYPNVSGINPGLNQVLVYAIR